MEFVLRHRVEAAQVSFVLLDWSCRESFHTIDYLNEQTIGRDRYEIIWIEYYHRRAAAITARTERARLASAPLPVDTYVVMGMPESVCYHKHLMYNLGILLASGKIVCICDSDALLAPGFVASVTSAFDQNGPMVLHYDEVRNNDARFWPFRRPSFDGVTGVGCINWINGRPLGLVDTVDPLHTRNYGACMCALREDLIAIGGADLHRDYLGHICGPYELTFRLGNYGRKEVWHQTEWLYHVWHPGQGGDRNYAGPHDGRHMSTTALAFRENGSWWPHLESPAIRRLRQGEPGTEVDLVAALVPPEEVKRWEYANLHTVRRTYNIGGRQIDMLEGISPHGGRRKNPAPPILGFELRRRAWPWLLPLVAELLWRELLVKCRVPTRLPRSPRFGRLAIPIQRVRSFIAFMRRMLTYNRDRFVLCWRHLSYACLIGARDLVLYGDGTEAEILCALSRFLPVRIRAVCPFRPVGRDRLLGRPVRRFEDLARSPETILLASFTNTAELLDKLERAGVEIGRIIVLH